MQCGFSRINFTIVRFFQRTIIKHHCSIRINCRKTQLLPCIMICIILVKGIRLFSGINRQLQLQCTFLPDRSRCKNYMLQPLNSIGIRGFLQVDLHNTALCILVSCQFRATSLSIGPASREAQTCTVPVSWPHRSSSLQYAYHHSAPGRRRDSIFTQIIHRGSGNLDSLSQGPFNSQSTILLNLFHRRCLKALLLILGILSKYNLHYLFYTGHS